MADVVALADAFRAELMRGDAQAIEQMTTRWGEIEARLQTAVHALAQEIQASEEEVPRWKLYRLARYQALLVQLSAEMATFNQWVAGQLEEAIEDKHQLARSHAQQMVNALIGGRVRVALDVLPIEAIERVTAIAQAGQPLQALLARSYPTAVDALANHLLTAIAKGENPRTAVRQAVRQGMAQGLSHLLLVFRDQQIRHYREMTRHVYDRSEAVTGYVRLAAKNKRTCLACLALDGTAYTTDELMPLHPQCRCTMVPVVRGFPPPSFQTGEQWFRSQPHSVQKEMMGQRRFEAWQNGRFAFQQLAAIGENETWGPTAVVTSISKLL